MSSFDFDKCEWITVGTIGEPGNRTFYLQARQDGALVSLKMEKQQVSALAEGLGDLLVEHAATAELPDPDVLDLVEPVFAEWAVGSMALSFSAQEEIVLLGCEEMVIVPDDLPEDDWPPPHTAKFLFSRAQAAGIATRGTVLMFLGRPDLGEL